MENIIKPEGANQIPNIHPEAEKYGVLAPNGVLNNALSELEDLKTLPGISSVGSEVNLTPEANTKVVLPDKIDPKDPKRSIFSLEMFRKKKEEEKHGLQHAA